MGLLKGQKKILAFAFHRNHVVAWSFACCGSRLGGCSFHLHTFLENVYSWNFGFFS